MPDLQDQAVVRYLSECGLPALTDAQQQALLQRAESGPEGLVALLMADYAPDEDQVARALASLFGMAYVEPDGEAVDQALLAHLGETWWSARHCWRSRLMRSDW